MTTLTTLWRRYGRPSLPTLAVVYVPLGLLLVAVKLAAVDQHASALIEPSWSPSESITRGSLWVGGLAGWCWALGAGIIGWAASRRSPRAGGRSPARARLLLGAAVLSALMLADDLFQLHEPTIPDASGLGSGAVLAVYGSLFALWLWSSRAEIAHTDVGILAIALGFFGLWLVAKSAPGVPERIAIAAGAKLGGIAGWAAYLTRTAAATTTPPSATPPPTADRRAPTRRRGGDPGRA